MSKRRKSKGQPGKSPPLSAPATNPTSTRKGGGNALPLVGGVLLAAAALSAAVFWMMQHRAAPRSKTRAPGTITFHQDIGPMVRARCASCHGPGQAAPFRLWDYADVKGRAQEIA